MAKTRHQSEPTSNKAAMLVMVAGGVLVAALVIWALTRTVEPATQPIADTPTASPVASTEPVSPATETPSATAAAVGTTATATAPPRPQGDRSSVQRIAVEDLRAKMNRHEVTVIDVRDANSFATKHIAGAINIPFASVESMIDQIPKDKSIVTYCSCPAEETSGGAALILTEKGFSDVQALYGGFGAWQSLGYPTEP